MSDLPTPKVTKKTPLKSDGWPSHSPNISGKSQLPQVVNVLGVPFRVEVTDIGEDNWGETVGWKRRIQISNDSDTRRLWTTLLHEWVHAVLYVNGAANILPNEVEEMIAQTMEHALEEMLLQIGPQVLAVLKEDK
jgi:hypothetical protein